MIIPRTFAACNRICVYAACTALAVILNYFFQKEMAWDLLHYHFYLGFSALNERFEQDYFPAGIQSYFNPYAYVPFYGLVIARLPALLVGSVLALFHSMVLWLTYELAWEVSPSKMPQERLLFGVCVTTMTLMNPIFLQQIGSSFADITTAGLVVGGWLLLVQAIGRPRALRLVAGAILLGIASGLKQTNVLHALCAFVLVAFVRLPNSTRIRSLAYFGLALAASFLLAIAPWAYRSAQGFGNPTQLSVGSGTASPGFASNILRIYHSLPHRFIPDSLTEALLRPFAIVGRGPMIHEELSAPDIRYALLLLVFLITAVAWCWRSVKVAPDPVTAARSESADRALAALGCAFTVDWILWLIASGNGRYFIPMACVAATLAFALLFRLLASHRFGRNALLVTLFLAQGAQLAIGADYRWNPAPWKGKWFNVELPEKLAREPNLYLSIGGPSNSFLVPFLPKESGFINLSSNSVLGPDGAAASHVRSMAERRAPYVRVLVSGKGIFEDALKREPRQSDIDDILHTFGLRVDMTDCETITIQGLRLSIWRAPNSSIPAPRAPRGQLRYTSHLASCHVVADTRDQSKELAARRAVDLIFNRLEDACPILFQPPRRQSEHINQIWLRRYEATDLTAWIGNGDVKVSDAVRNPFDIYLGREETWAKGSLRVECGRQNGVYFARLAPDEP